MELAATHLIKNETVSASGGRTGRRNRVTVLAELSRLEIKERLRQAREAAHLTQPEMGEALADPVHWRTIQNWESAATNTVPFNRLDDWARITGVTKHWLLHGDEEAPVPSDVQGLGAEVAAIREQIGRMEAVLASIQRMLGDTRSDSG